MRSSFPERVQSRPQLVAKSPPGTRLGRSALLPTLLVCDCPRLSPVLLSLAEGANAEGGRGIHFEACESVDDNPLAIAFVDEPPV